MSLNTRHLLLFNFIAHTYQLFDVVWMDCLARSVVLLFIYGVTWILGRI